MGRPRLPTELKKLKGTLNPTREKKSPPADTVVDKLGAIFPEGTKISCPKTITDKYVKSYWKKLTATLIALRVLSPVDLPQIEQLCVILEKLREIQSFYLQMNPLKNLNDFSSAQTAYISLSNKFDQLAAKYYISPAARAKLRLDELNIVKTEQELKKNESAISALIGDRK